MAAVHPVLRSSRRVPRRLAVSAGRLVAAAAVVTSLAACSSQALEVPEEVGSAPYPPGLPSGPLRLGDETLRPCTERQMDRYPGTLEQLSPIYYAGPWCGTTDAGTQWVWVYAKPLTEDETPQEIRAEVNSDARIMVRDLRTSRYQAISAGPPPPADVNYAGKRPTSPNLVTVTVTGADVPPYRQPAPADEENPLSLRVGYYKADLWPGASSASPSSAASPSGAATPSPSASATRPTSGAASVGTPAGPSAPASASQS